jgi:hypothetical protein
MEVVESVEFDAMLPTPTANLARPDAVAPSVGFDSRDLVMS